MQLQIRDITKSFGPKQVLKGISMNLESGKALGLLGRNGAGKTTTIRIVMDVFPADSGEVLLDGGRIDRSRIQIGYLPEERGLYPKQIILDQLIYFAALRGIGAGDARRTAKRILERLDMSEYTTKKLDTLSKGNQQKIQLAATLISNPDIIILDEPFSGLDPVNAMLLKDIVKELMAEGKMILFSSHQMNYIEEFCSDIAILSDGKIALGGSLRDIKRAYDRSRIVVSSTQCGKIEAFAREKLGEIVAATEPGEGSVTLKLLSAGQKGALLSALAGAGFDIDAIKVYEPSLNDIFVEVTEVAI